MRGRPKKELSILPLNWEKYILELYSEGGSDAEVKALIYSWLNSFSNNLWDRWMDQEPIFWETIKKGRMLSQAWWEVNGRKNLKTKEFNYTGWYMNMKNRFGWADKTENKNENKVNVKIDASKYTDEELNFIAELQRKGGIS